MPNLRCYFFSLLRLLSDIAANRHVKFEFVDRRLGLWIDRSRARDIAASAASLLWQVDKTIIHSRLVSNYITQIMI